MSDLQERLDSLDEAAVLINEAISMISFAVEGTDNEASANAYILSHLSNWANGNNPYDESIPVLKRALKG